MTSGRLTAAATLTDVAFAVARAMEKIGERVVLCGGSAATFYVPEAYQSRDLDFVISFGARARVVRSALAALGYERAPEGLYAHPDVAFTIDILPGPVAIDEETITDFHVAVRDGGSLHVLLPFDVVRDRVLHFWAWGDQRALSVAADVMHDQRQRIDVERLTAWISRLAASGGYDPRRAAVIREAIR